MRKGIASNKETTSLLGQEFLLEAENLVDDINGVKVREGIGLVTPFDSETEEIIPIAIETVNIGGSDLVLLVSKEGYVYAIYPQKRKFIYKVYRKHYKYAYHIRLKEGNEAPPSNVKIIHCSEYVYLLSTEKCYLIRSAGCEARDSAGGVNYLFVDAFDATIYDADGEELKLYSTDRYSSSLVKDTELYYKIRNEIGGRGKASLKTFVPQDDSYLVAGIKGMRQDVFGVARRGKFITKIIGHAVRTTDNGTGTEDYYVDFYNSEDSLKQLTSKTDGLVANEDSNLWRNGTLNESGNHGMVADKQSVEIVSAIKPAKVWDDDMVFGSGTPFLYTCCLVFDKHDNAKLIVHIDEQSKFTSGQIFVVPYLVTGYSATNGEQKQKVNWLVKVTSSGTPVTFEDANTYQIGVNQASALGGFVAYETPDAVNYSYIFDVEISGIKDFRKYIYGSGFNASDSASQHYTSYTVYPIYISVDSSDDPVDPMIICDKFVEEPSSNYSLTVDITYTVGDIQDWYRLDSLVGLTWSIQLIADIDGDNGLHIRDAFWTTYSNMDIIVYGSRFADPHERGDWEKFYDVFEVDTETDYILASSFHNRRKTQAEFEVISFDNYYTFDDYYVNPLLICHYDIFAFPFPKIETSNVGSWTDAVFYEGKFFFAENSRLKITDMQLQWKETNVLELNGKINFMLANSYSLFVFTEKGIYYLDRDFKVKPLSTMIALSAVVYGKNVIFVNNDGSVWKIDVVPFMEKSASETYKVVPEGGGILKNITDQWTVYSMAVIEDKMYMSTSHGIFYYNLSTKAWFKHTYSIDDAFHLINYKDTILAYGGNLDNTTFEDNYSVELS